MRIRVKNRSACKVDVCTVQQWAGGYCWKHYQRVRRYGSVYGRFTKLADKLTPELKNELERLI